MRPTADTVLIWTGAACSNGCPACPIAPATAGPGAQPADVLRHLEPAAGTGRLAVLAGAEPFLRPDIFRLMGAVRARGYAPGVLTTGRPLLSSRLRERLRGADLAYLRVQFFGVGAAHDRATAVPGGFVQAVDGVRAWIAESGGACDVDVALTLRGAATIDSVAENVAALADALASAPTVQIILAIDTATRSIDPIALDAAVTALAAWNASGARPLLAWEGLPDTPAASSALRIAGLRRPFIPGPVAASCLGETIAAPIAIEPPSPHANSFNFVRGAATVPWRACPEECTADRAGAAVDLQRSLWLVEGDRLVLYETDTGDFSAAEIARIKDEWSHLFLDRAPAGVLDDFTEGMRRLRADPACATCPRRRDCAGRFVMVDGPPFAREEAWITDYVARLRGQVLDVGCGEQLYRSILAPLLRSGAVQYTGLDPDEPSLASARAALPEGRFFLGGIEQFRGQPGHYDHVLCLRSLNHVFDVDESVARMAELLKPGGSLLMVETTPFAMLRRPEQVAAADHAPRAGHQHYRNVTSTEVLPLARRRGLHVVEEHAAGLAGTNEWILLLRRQSR